MSQAISLSEPTYALLQRLADRERLSPDLLAERLLSERLSAEFVVWREEVEALIAKVQTRTLRFSSAEIEADITAASAEIKELRRARRAH